MIRSLDKYGLRLLHAYGLTESSPLAFICTLRPHMRDWPVEKKYTIRRLQAYAEAGDERAIADLRRKWEDELESASL